MATEDPDVRGDAPNPIDRRFDGENEVIGRTPGQPSGEVTLRDVTAADVPIFFAHQWDREATRMAAFPAMNREVFGDHWSKLLRDDRVIAKTILFDGQVAGNIVSYVQDGKPFVGYWLGKAFWGKGIATRALAEFLGYVEVRPLYANVAKHNIGSIRVLEKRGFVVVGEAVGFLGEEYLFELKGDGG
jgi:RimJ/RimL family protein N-acetyltransferase